MSKETSRIWTPGRGIASCLVILLLFGVCMLSAVCQAQQRPQAVKIDHSTVEALLGSFRKALVARDYPALKDAVDPNMIGQWSELLAVEKELDRLADWSEGTVLNGSLGELAEILCSKESELEIEGKDVRKLRKTASIAKCLMANCLRLIDRRGKWHITFGSKDSSGAEISADVIVGILIQATKADREFLELRREVANTSPFKNLDYYLGHTWFEDRREFFPSVRDKSLQKTVETLKDFDMPWYGSIRGGGTVLECRRGHLAMKDWWGNPNQINEVTEELKALALTGWSRFPRRRPTSRPQASLATTQPANVESPFVIVDRYMEYLTPSEKSAFLGALQEKGFEKTFAGLETSASWAKQQPNEEGMVATPRGLLSKEPFEKYRRQRKAIFEALKSMGKKGKGKKRTGGVSARDIE